VFVDCSKVDFVLFETAGTLRDALIRDWILLSQDRKNELRQYLFQFIMRDGNIAAFVRERILQVIYVAIYVGIFTIFKNVQYLFISMNHLFIFIIFRFFFYIFCNL